MHVSRRLHHKRHCSQPLLIGNSGFGAVHELETQVPIPTVLNTRYTVFLPARGARRPMHKEPCRGSSSSAFEPKGGWVVLGRLSSTVSH